MRHLESIWTALIVITIAMPALGQSAEELSEEERLEQAVYYSDLGRLHFDNERFPQAAEAFAQAWEFQPDPVLGYNAARSYENTGELQLALQFYAATLELEIVDEEIGRRCRDGVTRIENTLARIQQAQESAPAVLTVETQPTGASVWFGEVLMGVTPLELSLDGGDYAVRLESDGFVSVTTDVALEPGQTFAMRVSLVEIRQVGAPDPAVPVETHPNWIAVGATGGVAVVLTTVAAILAVDAHEQYDRGELAETLRNPDQLEQTISAGQASQGTSALLYATGVAAAITAVILVFVTEVEETPESTDEVEVSFDFGASATGGSAGLRVRF